MLSVVKMLLKGEVGGCALNSPGNYIVDHGILWKNHGIVFLNFVHFCKQSRPRLGSITDADMYLDMQIKQHGRKCSTHGP